MFSVFCNQGVSRLCIVEESLCFTDCFEDLSLSWCDAAIAGLAISSAAATAQLPSAGSMWPKYSVAFTHTLPACSPIAACSAWPDICVHIRQSKQHIGMTGSAAAVSDVRCVQKQHVQCWQLLGSTQTVFLMHTLQTSNSSIKRQLQAPFQQDLFVRAQTWLAQLA